MLKQILSDMYVDPELLAELSEEQKQILFFKMRQEQIKRWKEREAVAMAPKPARKKAHGKSVQWKLGADGDVWVWIMGEHSLDKPYDLLCSEILAERVRQQSLQEAEAIRRGPVEGLTDIGLGSEIPRDSKNPMIGQKDMGNPSATANDPNQDQPPANKPRGIEQMLADSVRHSRKYGIQQNKDNLTRTTMNETGAQGDRISESTQKQDKEDPDWLESLQRSKAEDERRRTVAKHARDDYKRLSLQGIHKGKAAEISKILKAGEQKQMVPPPLPPKPKNLPAPRIVNGRPERKQGIRRTVSSSTQEAIVQWFKEEQLPIRAGFEKSMDSIAPWFHEGCKHFLIDASGDSYSFLGVDQLQHSTLADLVDYHKDEPITSLGKELLRYPCGQRGLEPDYLDLFE
ncbi:SH2 domain-containing protein 4A isoform X2 [Sceloporus undulatus]|uniref:SH2 domain-containing protein 4A isoform X2 n=1 Tax=Sceloporus undulatus TaxID=8520 RepID=UPI001C4C1C09|nr:SH2 domain-containing protein 4A isoform X2 [Sceloporus undulatus]